MYARRLPSLLFLLCSFLLLVSAYKSDIPALRQQPDVARELAQPVRAFTPPPPPGGVILTPPHPLLPPPLFAQANTYVWGACSRSNLGLGMYAAQNFNHMAQLMCITPQSGGLTFGAQDLTISNPDGAPLTIYHTDGSDCYTTGSYFAHYGGCMKTSSSTSISSSCPLLRQRVLRDRQVRAHELPENVQVRGLHHPLLRARGGARVALLHAYAVQIQIDQLFQN
jgi:hypothetical protein